MKKYVIIADVNCDLNEQFREQYDIKIVHGHLHLPDEPDAKTFLKWEKYTREEFYNALRKNPNAYTTSPPNVEEFAAAFSEWAEKGYDILVMTISGGISGANGFATSARAQVLEKYPDTNIRIVDTLRFGPGFGLMVVYAAMERERGRTLDETAAYLEENKNRFHQAGWMDDLSFVAKKGRINHPTAFFGTLAGIKTIGEFDYNGLTTVIGKVKGAKSAYSVLLSYIAETIQEPEEQIIFIAQTNRYAAAEEFKRLIEERFHPKAVYINDVFPSCGINIGPGLMAAYYVGKPISADLGEERAIIEKYANGGTSK